jgi:hypothetical protein
LTFPFHWIEKEWNPKGGSQREIIGCPLFISLLGLSLIPYALYPGAYALFNSEVQLGQRVAWMGIAVKQKEQSLVVGTAGGASSCLFKRLILRITIKMAKATIRKLMIVLMNTPKFIVTAPAALAAATEV